MNVPAATFTAEVIVVFGSFNSDRLSQLPPFIGIAVRLTNIITVVTGRVLMNVAPFSFISPELACPIPKAHRKVIGHVVHASAAKPFNDLIMAQRLTDHEATLRRHLVQCNEKPSGN